MLTISVCILSHQRPGDLCWVIDSVLAQDCHATEILIIDNNSGPELHAALHQYGELVRVLALPENLGVAARTVGISAARGDVIVTLDDDVGLADRSALRKLVGKFEEHPDASCITFRILKPDLSQSEVDWGHPKPIQIAGSSSFETSWISEGGCAFRRSVFERVRPYWRALHFGMEGPELALRMIDANATIRYESEIRVIHLRSQSGRTLRRAYFHNTRGLFLMAWRNIPARSVCRFLFPRVFALGVLAVRDGAFMSWAVGARSGFLDSFRLRHQRVPVTRQAWIRYRDLRREMPNLGVRFQRYLANYPRNSRESLSRLFIVAQQLVEKLGVLLPRHRPSFDIGHVRRLPDDPSPALAQQQEIGSMQNRLPEETLCRRVLAESGKDYAQLPMR